MAADVDEIRTLQTLLDASQALSQALELEPAIRRVLGSLARHHGALRGLVVLFDDKGERAVEVAERLDAQPSEDRARFDAAIARVHARARGVIERSKGPRAGPRAVVFFALPMVLDRRVVGVLAIDLEAHGEAHQERLHRFARVVASMIAQAFQVHRLVEGARARLLEETRNLREELEQRYEFSNIVGSSGPMRRVFEQIAQVAQGGTTVLVRGESGTGKELIAHAIHHRSPRARGPFVRVSCATLPETLVESELFGHERGAFTGAHARKKGRFELAEGGTLFLDEVGELSPSTQAKLLRVIQEREFERLGGTETLRADVRLITATNRDIEKAIASGLFREDLYYRLDVFTIFVPPLRDRKPDIMPLADHFVAKYAQAQGKKIRRVSTAAIDMLVSYHWPGNVRELENAIERAVVVCNGSVLHAHHLPPTLQTAEASDTVEARSLDQATATFERDLIQDALKSTRGNRAKAARMLGTTERILGYKVAKYAIDCARFRA